MHETRKNKAGKRLDPNMNSSITSRKHWGREISKEHCVQERKTSSSFTHI